jgi:hypothetical protein
VWHTKEDHKIEVGLLGLVFMLCITDFMDVMSNSRELDLQDSRGRCFCWTQY